MMNIQAYGYQPVSVTCPTFSSVEADIWFDVDALNTSRQGTNGLKICFNPRRNPTDILGTLQIHRGSVFLGELIINTDGKLRRSKLVGPPCPNGTVTFYPALKGVDLQRKKEQLLEEIFSEFPDLRGGQN